MVKITDKNEVIKNYTFHISLFKLTVKPQNKFNLIYSVIIITYL